MTLVNHRAFPLSALPDFEASARRGSFAAAASELGVTASAISQQVSLLERHIGIRLFERRAKSIAITPAGERLLYAVTNALISIDNTIGQLGRSRSPQEITIAMPAVFASGWFIPRMHRFRESYARFDITPRSSGNLLEPQLSGVEACVRYGRGGWSDVDCRFLFNEAIRLACAPAYLDRRNLDPDDFALCDHQLLASETSPDIWKSWLSPETADAKGRVMIFGDDTLLVQAALNGLGIAPLDCRLLSELIRNRQLVTLGDAKTSMGAGWYLVFRTTERSEERLNAVMDWFLSEVSR